jgi:hypothetical protein
MQSLLSLHTLLLLAGIGQLVLAAGSLAIPRVLGWKTDTAKLKPLTRQVFWTYAAYIWTINVCFGLISTFAPRLLLDRSPLAALVCGFITAYWAARVAVQFFYFDRSEAPPGMLSKLGDIALTGLFIYLTLVYGAATVMAISGGAP